MNLCKDCAHYHPIEFGFSKCKRTSVESPVTGETEMTFCDIERRDNVGCCGPDGKFYVREMKGRAA